MILLCLIYWLSLFIVFWEAPYNLFFYFSSWVLGLVLLGTNLLLMTCKLDPYLCCLEFRYYQTLSGGGLTVTVRRFKALWESPCGDLCCILGSDVFCNAVLYGTMGHRWCVETLGRLAQLFTSSTDVDWGVHQQPAWFCLLNSKLACLYRSPTLFDILSFAIQADYDGGARVWRRGGLMTSFLMSSPSYTGMLLWGTSGAFSYYILLFFLYFHHTFSYLYLVFCNL